jgi:hypothetical protein
MEGYKERNCEGITVKEGKRKAGTFCKRWNKQQFLGTDGNWRMTVKSSSDRKELCRDG